MTKLLGLGLEQIKRSAKFTQLLSECVELEKACSLYPVNLEQLSKMYKNKVLSLPEKDQKNITRVSPFIREYKEKLNKLAQVAAAKPITHIVISINWTRNLYGYQARATYTDDYHRYEGQRTGGCGYDKKSTAAADVLNTPAVRKIVLDYLKEHTISNCFGYGSVRELLGYGLYISEYNSLPIFEGGVGIECHVNILKKLGFKCYGHDDVLCFEKEM